MTLDLNAVHADYEAWQKAHQAFDTDEWHLTATKLAGWVPDLIAALAAVEQDRDRYRMVLETIRDQAVLAFDLTFPRAVLEGLGRKASQALAAERSGTEAGQ